MDGYSKMLMLFRNEGSKYNPPTLLLGEMTSSTDITIGKLVLDEDDYYISEHLTKPILTELNFTIDSSGGISHSHGWTDKSKYLKPLKKGDLVLLYPLNDDKFVVIDKVVEP